MMDKTTVLFLLDNFGATISDHSSLSNFLAWYVPYMS